MLEYVFQLGKKLCTYDFTKAHTNMVVPSGEDTSPWLCLRNKKDNLKVKSIIDIMSRISTNK